MSYKAELIVGAFTDYLPEETGVYKREEVDLVKAFGSPIFAPRAMLENDARVRHFITYSPLLRISESDTLVLVYRRPDKITGETRLNGKHSIGFGGHFELNDLGRIPLYEIGRAKNESAVSRVILEFIKETNLREIQEELKTAKGYPVTDVIDSISEEPEFVIIDNSDNVGLHHVGFSYPVHVQYQDPEIVSGEVDNIAIEGWYSLKDAKEKFGSTFENWSNMLLNKLIEVNDGE